MAGLLAAAALAHHVDTVTVVERDRVDSGPRPGVPQGRHAHLLLDRGFRAVVDLLPGVDAALKTAGARRLRMPYDVLTRTPSGWLPRVEHDRYLVACRRPTLETVLRHQVLLVGEVKLMTGADAVGLVGDADRVTAALVRDRDTGETRPLPADVVVDATGVSSRADRWLVDLGLPPVREVEVDAGIRYATGEFRAPFGDDFPAVVVQSDPNGPACGGVVLPVDDDRWLVSLAGLRGRVPPTDLDGFTAFAAGMRHPIIADLIAASRPLGTLRGYGAPPARLRHYDRVARWPEGFVVVGDAVATFNPVYGHGMTVAALDAVALRDNLRDHGPDTRTARRAIARVTAPAWALATGQDLRYPGTFAPPRTLGDRVGAWYADRLGAAAVVDPDLALAMLDAYTLNAPLGGLLRPAVLGHVMSAVLTGRPADEPPLTDQERESFSSPLR
ncbi:FAD-dependent monooxygenase [Saccharothrix violaceirubra]